jgi:hypothetical protein
MHDYEAVKIKFPTIHLIRILELSSYYMDHMVNKIWENLDGANGEHSVQKA